MKIRWPSPQHAAPAIKIPVTQLARRQVKTQSRYCSTLLFLSCSLKNSNDAHVTGLTEVSPARNHKSPLRLSALGQLLPLGSCALTWPHIALRLFWHCSVPAICSCYGNKSLFNHSCPSGLLQNSLSCSPEHRPVFDNCPHKFAGKMLI